MLFVQDLAFAARVNWKRPAFSLLVIATLAIGIGATSAMFSIVNAVLLRPLPFPRSERLVYAFGAFSGGNQASISGPDFLDYRAQTKAIASFAARNAFAIAVLSGNGGDDPERVSAPRVTANFFSTLGVRPLLGRGFLAEEEIGEHNVVVLSYAVWQRRFGGDQHVVGTTTSIDGRPFMIVGVMPQMIGRVLSDQIWMPMPFHTPELSARGAHSMRGLARLSEGVTLARAQVELDAIARRLEAAYPENASWHLRLVPYRDVVVGDSGPMLFILLGAVGLVLLVACANVASLMLARATSRQSEIAVRTALGASRSRIVRQLLTESALLGTAAGLLGLVLAVVLVRGARSFASDALPRTAEIHVDAVAVAFTMAVAVLTGIMFGLAPALHATRQDLASSMRSLGGSTGARHALRLRDALVVAQVGLSLVLLVGAGLLLRRLWEVQRVEPGFDSRGVVTAQISLPMDRVRSREDAERFWTAFLERVKAIPGVQHAVAANILPLSGLGDTYYYIEGHPPASASDKRSALINISTDDYFATLRIPMVEGRALVSDDRAAGEASAASGSIVISRSIAQRLFPRGGAVGSRLVVELERPFHVEIVGVAGDVRAFGQESPEADIIYLSFRQLAADHIYGTGRNMRLAVRSESEGLEVVGAIRGALRTVMPGVPLANVSSMDRLLSDAIASSAFRSRLLAAFALIALMLAVIGLYGILAYTVTQRTREFGVRFALGARGGEVVRLVVAHGMRLVVVGLAFGMLGAIAASRLLRSQLEGVNTTDPTVFLAVITLLAGAGLAACVVPARRATRISPITALRDG